MIREPMLFVATSDISGKLRGKAFPSAHWDKRKARGVGWTPTNVQITCFDAIAESPYGALGDLLLVPDPNSHVKVDFDDAAPPENFMLGDIVTLDGEPWECCTRSILKSALQRLERLSGFALKAAFEHEFHLKGLERPLGDAYTMAGYRASAEFCSVLMAALSQAGIGADTIMKEYGAGQYEATVTPETGVRAADAAVVTREMTYATALRLGHEASFTPIRDPAGVGNGLHIHYSFLDSSGNPATYDEAGPNGMAKLPGAFAAGILKYLDTILALTAPSAISYSRLTPHRWSAAFNNLGLRDREAALRICPTTAKAPEALAAQYNFEYRAADAAASPYLALAALVHAGCQGIEEELAAPPVTEEDLSLLEPEALAARGYARLPQTLPEALARFDASAITRGWYPPGFADVYLAHKRGELEVLAGMDIDAQCRAYEEVY